MDTKKIGAFLKQCRKENNLTQEQLAEKFGVSARTVSRWETGSNMPDLSILVELADYYDIEIKELLDGERSSTMNKEMKETLNKVADYEEWVKQKALKAGNLAFASMFLISVGAIIIQLLLAVNLRLVLGETLIALVGGIVYAFLMVHNGIWDKGLSQREALWRDFLTSVICAGIFSVLYGICLGRMGATEKQTIYLSLLFLGGITIVAFIVLRVLSYFNRKRRRISVNGEQRDIPTSKLGCTKIYNAKDIVEAGRIVELLKEHGIAAFSQEAGASVSMHGASGFGMYGISITKSYQRLKGKDVITQPKTPKSIRIITMPDFLTDEFREYCSHLYGIMKNERLFHFTKSHMEHCMAAGIEKSGVKRIRLHDLRHSHVSLS